MQTLFCWPEEKLSWYCELVSKKPHIQPIRSNICIHLELCKCPWWIKSNIHSMFSTVLLLSDSWGNISGSGLLFGAEQVVFSRLLELCCRLLWLKTTLMRVAGVNQYRFRLEHQNNEPKDVKTAWRVEENCRVGWNRSVGSSRRATTLQIVCDLLLTFINNALAENCPSVKISTFT